MFKNRIKNFRIKWSSPGLVPLIPFIITLIFFKGYFNEYKLRLISEDTIGPNLQYYYDINKDGDSEFIFFNTYENGYITINNINHKLEEVYNLPGKWSVTRSSQPVFYFGDLDKDGYDELFVFSANKEDSLFLSVIQHYPFQKIIYNKYITQLQKPVSQYDYFITPIGLEDNNGDKQDEFLFIISAGFPLQPRAIFAWDFTIDSIYRSPLMGGLIRSYPKEFYLKDINSDGTKEIFLRIVASDNYKDSLAVPYTDNDAWVMVFTKNLEFLFEPIKIEGAQSDVLHFPFEQGDSIFIGTKVTSQRANTNHALFQFYNSKGVKLSEMNFPMLDGPVYTYINKFNNKFYLTYMKMGQVKISLINPFSGKLIETRQLPRISVFNEFFDADGDGKEEIIAFSFADKKIYLIRSNLKQITEMAFKNLAIFTPNTVSAAIKNNKIQHLLLVNKESAIYFTYNRNNLYYLNFIFALLYYALLVIAFSQLKKAWLLSLKRKQQAEQQMQQLQLKTVMNQLNPHFTFNAINAVGSAILKNDARTAYESLARLSRLLRKSVDHTFQPYKYLDEEIDFVLDFLEIEKSRFGDKLEYEVNVQEEVNLKVKVPKMLIQIFVENAINHGIFHKKEGGRLVVEVLQQPQAIRVIVEDNGVGRAKASTLGEEREGKGMLILANYLRLFKEQFNREITFEIEDVMEEDQVKGTRVAILIHY